MKREFTASVYIVEKESVLLILHRKLGVWLPAGGHIDPDELPSDAAIREAKEETGLDVELMAQENVWVPQMTNGKSIPRPYLCLLEEIPEYKDVAAHQHIDFVFVGRKVGGALKHNLRECDGVAWFTLEELKNEKALYEETRSVTMHILSNLYPNNLKNWILADVKALALERSSTAQ